MTRTQINQKINKLSREIKDLSDKKNKYNSMNSQISNAVSKLNTAMNSINSASVKLKNNYSGNIATSKCNELQNQRNQISNIKSRLSGSILSESKRQINKINANIEAKRKEIKRWQRELRNMKTIN